MSRPRVVVGGLGPAGPGLITTEVRDLIARVPCVLRTGRHPAAESMDLPTCDDLYETAERIEDVYPAIVDRLAALAAGHGEIGYLVPGSPTVAERTVELLRARDDLEVTVLAALSFADLAWARLGVDPVAVGARLVDAKSFETVAAGEVGPLLVAQCDDTATLSAVKLALDVVDGEPPDVTVLQRLGSDDETVLTVAWHELDRAVTPDHLTSLWIPHLAPRVGEELMSLVELTRRLRRECPWDREQTHASLARHLLEEAYEVVEVLDVVDTETGTGVDELAEELGDLLFQVTLHSAIAAEEGVFDIADVARGIHDKLVSRHPHVFRPDEVDGTEHMGARWERLKAAEKQRASVMDGLPALPSVALAAKVAGKIEAAGGALADTGAALTTARGLLGDDASAPTDADAIGETVMALAVACRGAGIDIDAAVRAAVRRHVDAFRLVEPGDDAAADDAVADRVDAAPGPAPATSLWWVDGA